MLGIDPLSLICTLNFTIALHIFLSDAAASTCDMCPSIHSMRCAHCLLAGGDQGCDFCLFMSWAGLILDNQCYI